MLGLWRTPDAANMRWICPGSRVHAARLPSHKPAPSPRAAALQTLHETDWACTTSDDCQSHTKTFLPAACAHTWIHPSLNLLSQTAHHQILPSNKNNKPQPKTKSTHFLGQVSDLSPSSDLVIEPSQLLPIRHLSTLLHQIRVRDLDTTKRTNYKRFHHSCVHFFFRPFRSHSQPTCAFLNLP